MSERKGKRPIHLLNSRKVCQIDSESRDCSANDSLIGELYDHVPKKATNATILIDEEDDFVNDNSSKSSNVMVGSKSKVDFLHKGLSSSSSKPPPSAIFKKITTMASSTSAGSSLFGSNISSSSLINGISSNKLSSGSDVSVIENAGKDKNMTLTSNGTSIDGNQKPTIEKILSGKKKCKITLSLTEDEKMLNKLRSELGDNLAQQADLRVKEKKIRTAIRKVSRKIALGEVQKLQDNEQSKEKSKEQLLMSLFPVIKQQNEALFATEITNAMSVIPPLWAMAQGLANFDEIYESRCLNYDRDVVLLPLPTEDSVVLEFDTLTCPEANRTDTVSAVCFDGMDPIIDESNPIAYYDCNKSKEFKENVNANDSLSNISVLIQTSHKSMSVAVDSQSDSQSSVVAAYCGQTSVHQVNEQFQPKSVELNSATMPSMSLVSSSSISLGSSTSMKTSSSSLISTVNASTWTIPPAIPPAIPAVIPTSLSGTSTNASISTLPSGFNNASSLYAQLVTASDGVSSVHSTSGTTSGCNTRTSGSTSSSTSSGLKASFGVSYNSSTIYNRGNKEEVCNLQNYNSSVKIIANGSEIYMSRPQQAKKAVEDSQHVSQLSSIGNIQESSIFSQLIQMIDENEAYRQQSPSQSQQQVSRSLSSTPLATKDGIEEALNSENLLNVSVQMESVSDKNRDINRSVDLISVYDIM